MKYDKFKQRLKNVIKGQLFRGGNAISYVEVKELIRENSGAILIDVRSIQEYNEYHLNSAICIPYFEIQAKISNIIDNVEQIIILYCQSGARSKKAASILRKMGYKNVYELQGGIENI